MVNSKDICTIITTCAESGVSEIEFEGVRISFTQQAPKTEALPVVQVPLDLSTVKEADLTKEQKDELEDLAIQQMVIEDPEAYENYVLDQEFGA